MVAVPMVAVPMVADVENEIVRIVGKLRRNHRRIYPKMVRHYLDDVPVSVRTMRRYMVRMADDGQLARRGQRGGYVVSHPIEDNIIETVRILMISYDCVFPWMITADDLSVRCSVRTVRRYMSRLADDGRLVRRGQRGGYMVG